MDNQEKEAFAGTGGAGYEYPKLFTIEQFEERYGPDNCTIMLQDRERELYRAKQAELSKQTFARDEDAHQNMQTALDDWKPCDDRPPTEMEAKAQEVLSMSPQAQAVFIRHITAGIAQQADEQANVDAQRAAEQMLKLDGKFSPPADIGPPVTKPQQEPPAPASFEQLGADADHAADIKASGEDLRAPTAFDEGGLEGATEEAPEQTEVGMPPATER